MTGATQIPVLSMASDDEIPRLIALVAAEFPDLAIEADAVMDVQRWSQSVLSIKNDGALVGGFAALFLNDQGIDALLAGTLPMNRPPRHFLAGGGKPAVATYVWMFVARKYGTAASPAIVRWIWKRAPWKPIYGRPVNAALTHLKYMQGGCPVSPGSPLWVRHPERCP